MERHQESRNVIHGNKNYHPTLNESYTILSNYEANDITATPTVGKRGVALRIIDGVKQDPSEHHVALIKAGKDDSVTSATVVAKATAAAKRLKGMKCYKYNKKGHLIRYFYGKDTDDDPLLRITIIIFPHQ